MQELIKRETEYLLPRRIVDFSDAENHNVLLSAESEQIYLDNESYCLLKKGGYVVLDFGKELHGGIRIFNARANSFLRLRFGESVAEAYSELQEKNSDNYHGYRDLTVFVPSLSDLEHGQTGFRFLRMDNTGDEDLKLVCVYAKYVHIADKPTGSFCCDDPEINRIYDTAAYTLYLCMQNRLWDGIKRDRLVWLGDMYPESKGIYYMFGDHKLIEAGLCEIMQNTPADKWINNIPSYSLWWLIILSEYDFYCDKKEFFYQMKDYAANVIEKLDDSVTENGELKYTCSKSLFINWETCGERGLECANRGLALYALRKFYENLKRRNLSCGKLDGLIKRLEKNAAFDGCSKTIAAVYALGYGANDKVKEILLDGTTDGFSTFMSYTIASAIKDCGDGATALKLLKEFYSGMTERGATTFWESFDTSWLSGSGRIDELPKDGQKDVHSSFGKYCYEGFRLSLCHGWSCGPVQFLAENALGIKFVCAGGRKIKIQPDLMGLKWAKGVVPTKFGDIEIENRMTEKGIKTRYKLPKGVSVVD